MKEESTAAIKSYKIMSVNKSIKKEAEFDLDKLEKRIDEILKHEIEFES